METGWEWKQTGWYIEPTSARDVMTTIAAIGAYSSGQVFGWRGMSSVDYDLSSSLQRHLDRDITEEQLRAAEQVILRAARDWGLGIQPTGQVDDLQLLADLQHYGVPTRLLDFTANPMTALWFACQRPAESPRVAKTGVLLALNTTGWPVHHTVGGSDGLTWNQVGDPTGARLRNALAADTPFRVESRVPNDRLRAQEGFFVAGPIASPAPWEGEPPFQYRFETLTPFRGIQLSYSRGDSDQLLRDLLGPRLRGSPRSVPFVAVGIKSGLKVQLLRSLEGTYNRRARVLFPDFGGFLQHLDLRAVRGAGVPE